jgi:hypothetical protein
MRALPDRVGHDSVDADHSKYHRDATKRQKQGHSLLRLPKLLSDIFIEGLDIEDR